ncbi:MAG TPA: protease complex subunit PrcB family protein [Anaeromyxobacter sp.]
MSVLGRLALAAAGLFAACAAHRPRGPSSVTASVVRAGAQCGGEASGPSARWIGSEGAFRAAMGAGGVFGTEAATPDFRKEGVLAVFMGQRPTAGYGLALHDPTVVIQDGVGKVVVRLEEPQPGAMVAQVLTSPCLLIRMPKQGIRQLRVVDPAGTQLASANVGVLPEPRERRPEDRYPPDKP